jgi:hypothetical protein
MFAAVQFAVILGAIALFLWHVDAGGGNRSACGRDRRGGVRLTSGFACRLTPTYEGGPPRIAMTA